MPEEFFDRCLKNFFKKASGEYAALPVNATPYSVVYRASQMSLLEFQAPRRIKNGRAAIIYQTSSSTVHSKQLKKKQSGFELSEIPVIIVPSLINRWYILDLLPETSLVSCILEKRPCYMLDWGYPGCESSHLPLSYYYHTQIGRAVRKVKQLTGSNRVDMLGHCIGGTLAYAYSCLEPDSVRRLVLLTAPLDFSKSGILSLYAGALPIEAFDSSMEYMPGSTLALSFQFIQPAGVSSKLHLFAKNFHDEKFRRLFTAMERWSADTVNFPKKAYLDLIIELYRENRLYNGTLRTAVGLPVDPGKRKAELMIIRAAFDHIVPENASALPPRDTRPCEQVSIPAGHIGITVGKNGREARERIVDFFIK